MNDMIEKFNEWLNNNLRTIRYSDIPKFAREAKYFELDITDALSILNNRYDGESGKKDQESYLKSAWNYIKNVKTYSEYKTDKVDIKEYVKNKKDEDVLLSSIQNKLDNEVCFYNKLNEVKKHVDVSQWVKDHHKKYDKTSSFMLNIFDKNDIVWVSKNFMVNDITTEMKDMLTWANKNESLGRYNFFSINPYKSGDARKKEEIKKFKYMLLESDELTKGEQFLLWIDLIEKGLPVKTLTYTGNKSLHALVKVPNKIETIEEYEEYVGEIHSLFSRVKENLIDKACKNPDRLSRIPYGIRCEEKTDYEDVEQRLIYLAEDNKLKNDALSVVKKWVNDILPVKENTEEKNIDEIDADEVLAVLKDREIIHDIWNDGAKYHTFQKVGNIDENGEVTYSYIDKKWDKDAFFWDYIRQVINDQYKTKFELKDIKSLEVKFKNSMKMPYIGKNYGVRKDVVNTFVPGWLYQALNDDTIPSDLNEPLEKLLNNLFGEKDLERRWTLQWMREFMHTFTVMTAPVFWQIPGTGKTMLSKAFGEAIGDWIKTPPKKDDIQFNAWQDHTVIIFEESSSGNKRDGKDLGDLLKDWITESEKTIEAKGKDPVKKTIKSCYIFNANISDNVAPVFIEDNDRRYTIITNDNAKNLREIWTDKDYEDWNSGKLKKQLMKWIYNLPVDRSVDIKKGINNESKRDVVKLGKNNIELAIEDIVKTFSGFISNGDLIDMIGKQYGIRSTARANGNILKGLGYESTLKRVNGNVIRGYIFNGDIVEESNIIDQEDVFKGL